MIQHNSSRTSKSFVTNRNHNYGIYTHLQKRFTNICPVFSQQQQQQANAREAIAAHANEGTESGPGSAVGVDGSLLPCILID